MKNFISIMILLNLPLLFVLGQEKTNEPALLMQLDRDFDKAAAEKGIDGWVAYFAPNGSMLDDTNRPAIGLLEIGSVMEQAFKDSSFSLRWQPTQSGILIPDNLGYTVGRFTRLRRNKEGKLMKWTGSYSTIWKKQPNGTWKIVLDTGNADGPAIEVK